MRSPQMPAQRSIYATSSRVDWRRHDAAKALSRDNLFVFIALLAFIILEVTAPRIGARRINIPLAAGILACTVPFLLGGIQASKLGIGTLLAVFAWFGYFSWCLVSFYWSVGASDTILHGAFLMCLLPIAVAASRIDPAITMKWLLRMVAVVCVLSWIALIVSPSLAVQNKGIWRLKGVMEHEFRLGYLCATAIIVMAISRLRGGSRAGGLRFWPLLMLFVVTLIATQTRTLLAYTVTSVLLIVSLQTRGYVRILAILGVAFLILGAVGFADTIEAIFSRGESDASLSGRTYIWDKTMELAVHRPWAGYGFASFLNPHFDYIWNDYRPPHAHSMWVNSYFETGLIGSVLLGLAFFITFICSVRSAQVSRGVYAYSAYILFFVGLSGLTGLVLGGKLTTLYGISLILFFQEAYRVRVGRQTRHRKADLFSASKARQQEPVGVTVTR